MLINRTLIQLIKDKLAGESRVIILYGPRQSGKTVLLSEIVKSEKKRKVLFLKGDDIRIQNLFSIPRYDHLKSFIGDASILIIDEAQKIENIGASLKLLYDSQPMHILVSGSASFDLANKMAEPMTGRATFFTLYPLSFLEIPKDQQNYSVEDSIPELLIYGMYPKIHTLSSLNEKQEYLYDIVNTYLYQDLLSFKEIKKPKKILDLLSLLALQIGSEVNIRELSNRLILDRETVEKYLDILEKMFIVINLRGFNRNLQKEIFKNSKYYFVDLGLRNALIRNFNSLDLRNDTGSMFENFAFIERVKALTNRRDHANWFFWRTYDQKEIDLIEEKGGRLRAAEFKFSARGKIRKTAGNLFLKTYERSTFEVVVPETLKTYLVS